MNTQFSLQNRTAIVTGAGQGMGRACVRALCALGASLAINGGDLMI